MKSAPPIKFQKRENILIMKAAYPTLDFYKFLYGNVGKDITWVDRLMMDENELLSVIHHAAVEIFVLYYSGVPAGFIELDGRIKNEIEVAYFGLMPDYRGKKLGKHLLQFAIAKVFSSPIDRLWLHTCELDHPSALQVYKSAGFVMYDEKIIEQVLPS